MFSKPEGPHLTEDQARDLDDQFLSSRPREYFRARIASLLAPRPPAVDLTSGAGAEFGAELGAPEVEEGLRVSERDRELQVSVDAFSLRHHAAESLARLYHAIAIATPDEGASKCLWAAIIDGPPQIADLVTQAREHLTSQHGKDTFWTLVLPPEVATVPAEERHRVNQAATMAGQWLLRSLDLLDRDDLSLNSAHNKVKHGLAVRPEDRDMIRFTTRGPNEDNTIPLSAINGEGSFSLFEGGSLTFLSRPRRHGGLELAGVSAAPGRALAETWLIVETHAAMFHLAARRHFAGRDDYDFPSFPPLPLGPSPKDLLGDRIMGLRSPLTKPRKGGGEPRPAALAWTNGHIQPLTVDYAGGRRGVEVVDDAV